MFPFHQSCELSFQTPNNEVEKQPCINTTTTTTNTHSFYLHQDVSASNYNYHTHLLNNTTCNTIIRSPKSRKGGPPRSLITTKTEAISNNYNINQREDEISESDIAKKRSIHRDIERQRRQEMSNLYSSLRSLLPLEHLKGKRSICDHISEAAKHIKDLEKSVKELGDKRDKLKVSSLSENRILGEGGCSLSSTQAPLMIPCSRNDVDVSIHAFSRTIQIEISVRFGEDEHVFPLSRVLEVLIKQGFNVVSCVSSKVNQRWIYVIHCEVNDVTSIDLHDLERKLTGHIASYD